MKEIITICEYSPRFNEFKNRITRSSGWYFHGQLENDLGFDLGRLIDLPEDLIETYTWRDGKFSQSQRAHIEGIFSVKVIGIDKPCIGFFYIREQEPVMDHDVQKGISWEQAGLVVYEDDIEAIEYAKNAMETKQSYL